MEAAFWVTVGGLIASQVPDDQSLVATAGEEHVWAGGNSISSWHEAGITRSMQASTYFSKEVARDVTHPEWPSRVPRSTNCSAMLAVNRYDEEGGL
jgi:hypothetical protein